MGGWQAHRSADRRKEEFHAKPQSRKGAKKKEHEIPLAPLGASPLDVRMALRAGTLASGSLRVFSTSRLCVK
jgi:hypothetical protein